VLSPGNGKKRNGMATIPPEFEEELERYFAARGNPKANEPLLVSADGSKLDLSNVSYDFRRALILSTVHRFWSRAGDLADEADHMAVAELLRVGKHRGFDGPPPKDLGKIAKRKRRVEVTEAVVELIGANDRKESTLIPFQFSAVEPLGRSFEIRCQQMRATR